MAEHRLKEFRWGPSCRGGFCKQHPLTAGWRPESLSIPMICGTVLGEHQTNYKVHLCDGKKNEWDEETIQTLAEQLYGGSAGSVLAAFRSAYPEHGIADALYADRRSRRLMSDFARKRAEMGGSVWNYVYALESPMEGGLVAWHFCDVAYAFHNAGYLWASQIPDAAERVQNAMCDAWSTFAHTGSPQHDGIPTWPCATAEHLPSLIFDRDIRVGIDHDRALQKIFTELFAG